MELIVQGDDVTRQMWHMYSVFEEIFGTTTGTATATPLRRVVVGDRLLKRGSPARRKPPTSPDSPAKAPPNSFSSSSSSSINVEQPVTKDSSTSSNTTTTASVDTGGTTVVAQSASSTTAVTVAKETKPPERKNSTSALQSKALPATISLPQTAVPPDIGGAGSGSLSSSDRPSDSSSSVKSEPTLQQQQPPRQQQGSTSNPLLDTIGALATANLDSDDSDLDVVYQRLHYRQHSSRQEQQQAHRTKTAGSTSSSSSRRSTAQRHQQVAGSDPESISGYAGSNSIDSGYKSLCATPEVSDSLSSGLGPPSSADVIRRSASDVSGASDSSTTSATRTEEGGKGYKIKMGTRSVAGSRAGTRSSPRHTAVDDVALDHLMYLRQSLRKDAQRSSPSDSIPSSGTSATFREGDLSPMGDWRTYPHQSYSSPSSESGFTPSSSRPSSRREEPLALEQEGGGEGCSSSDFLLSGVEYYDLESIQEFPPASRNYVTMLEEKTRRFQVVTAPRCVDPLTDRPLSSLYRKRSESSQSVDGSHRQQHHHHHHHPAYGPPPPRPPRKAMPLTRHTDSRLTEAAIRVLEMIEDFRMEEAMSRSGRQVAPPPHHQHHRYPAYPSSTDPYLLAPPPRSRKGGSTGRPASTGSLMEVDARSVASYACSSAEHHVYEEIAYDLVRDRPPPAPPERSGVKVVRSRLLPMPPQRIGQQQSYAVVDPRRVVLRSHKRSRSGNLHAAGPERVHHSRSDVDSMFEMEWHMDRRENLPPDFPV